MCFPTDFFLFNLTTAIFCIVFLIRQTSVANYFLLLGIPDSQKNGHNTDGRTLEQNHHYDSCIPPYPNASLLFAL